MLAVHRVLYNFANSLLACQLPEDITTSSILRRYKMLDLELHVFDLYAVAFDSSHYTGFKGTRRRIDYSPGNIVVGYTVIWARKGRFPVVRSLLGMLFQPFMLLSTARCMEQRKSLSAPAN